ncbi:MAG: hypothetical protein IKK00_01605 [Oscillospiraceae bacterium]|nr:hypothetical protein [Oscillospiraceae bacterium]
MIHIFNRKALITTLSDQQLFRIQSALTDAKIPYFAKPGAPAFSAGRYRAAPFINHDAVPTVIYVKSSDYGRAKAAIQAVL